MNWYQRLLKKPKASFGSLAVICICFYAYTVITAPPTIEATSLRPTTPPVSLAAFPFEGTVSPASELSINGEKVPVQSNGRFSYTIPLSEGNNTVNMTIKKNGKTVTRSYSLYRFTNQEVAARNTTD